MKLARFLLLILRRGSLFHTPIDFSAERQQLLALIRRTKKVSREKKKLTYRSGLAYTMRANLGYALHARHMNTQLFVSSKDQLVYVRILKSASTSFLKEFLPRIDPELNGQELSDEQIDAIAFDYAKTKLTPEEHSFQKMALVRNPFQRLVSVYLDLFDPANPRFSYDAYWFGILKKGMSFGDFVSTVDLVPEYLRGPHFASQHFTLSRAAGLDQLKVFRIDKDQQALATFLNRYAIRLSHRNQQTAHYDSLSFYDSETLEKAYRLYEKDVVHFGYAGEYQALQAAVSTIKLPNTATNDTSRAGAAAEGAN